MHNDDILFLYVMCKLSLAEEWHGGRVLELGSRDPKLKYRQCWM